ncbi:MAG TPA: hypothetical protein VMU57_01315 [Edaphobacter sp.]|uniref:hypothetical protein n=1 Tax=Edaphobacter sp. TaxID=1934404 RepID=UPI002B7C1964|nr:hypothetical protein [Edaphobacter sp.]HUZ93532.1 hypothetical protein [Edaphobacter sp.]
MRAILWAQGYSTRFNVLLSYEITQRGKSEPINLGLTDLDVLGVRLDPGFRLHLAIADCKTVSGRVPERMFWLAGVAKFFGSDTNYLVRSQPFPEHVPSLARSLDISLVGPKELPILLNTYPQSMPEELYARFHDFSLHEKVTRRLSPLPAELRDVERYRNSQFWMDPSHLALSRVILSLSRLARSGSGIDATIQCFFSDMVWLFTVSLWRACAALVATGLADLEQSLYLYLNGYEAGTTSLERWRRAFEALGKKAGVDTPLPTHPPYFSELLELIVRCIRRPGATAKMARRAEWLLSAQLVGGLGSPPWLNSDDDVLAEKLLDDVARFLVRHGRLSDRYATAYSALVFDQSQVEEVLPVAPAGEAAIPPHASNNQPVDQQELLLGAELDVPGP